MKISKRYFKCWKCGTKVYTTDGGEPNCMCVTKMAVRTSGICGGSYTEISKNDFNVCDPTKEPV